MIKNATPIKCEITINVCVSVKIHKSIICAKKIRFGIMLPAVVKMVNMYEILFTNQW